MRKLPGLVFVFLPALICTSNGICQQAQDTAQVAVRQQTSASSQPSWTEHHPEQQNPTFADRLNGHFPSWLNLSGELRFRSAGVLGDFYRGSDDSYLLTRLRLNLRIKPTNWLQFYFQGQDAHVVGAGQTASLPPLQQDAMDLRLAYIQLGDIKGKSFQIKVGRQELAFGEERLIGPANWLNTPRSFDGAAAAVQTKSVRLDFFAASVVKIHDGQFNENTPGNNIYGVYSSLSQLVADATLEPYFFWRRQSGLTTETKHPGISNFGTVGVRWKGKLPPQVDYDLEMAKQTGSLGTDTIDAWAGHWRVGYTLSRVQYLPRFVAEYNYATGDQNSSDGKRGTFDQLFPSAHDMYGLTDQVGWKNIHHIRGGIELKPTDRWMLSSKESVFWLADLHDALYNAASIVVARSPTGTAGKYVGNELDFTASYKFSRNTTYLGGFGHLFPGNFLKAVTPGRGYSYPYAAMTYSF